MFCIRDKFNVMGLPKCACRQIIHWASKCNGFGVGEDRFESGRRNRSYDPLLPTYVSYRFPHERIRSFFFDKRREEQYSDLALISFDRFVGMVENNFYNRHHLRDREYIFKISNIVALHTMSISISLNSLAVRFDLPRFPDSRFGGSNYNRGQELGEQLLERIVDRYRGEYELASEKLWTPKCIKAFI